MKNTILQFQRSTLEDFLVFIFLVVVSFFLYIQYAPSLQITSDAYGFMRESYDGMIPWYLTEKRPFNGMVWNIAKIVGGGTLLGYRVFMYSCYLLSSFFVYLILVQIIPQHKHLAFTVASFKLVWIAFQFDAVSDFNTSVLFPEMLMLISLFIYLHLSKSSVKYVSHIPLVLLMATSLLISLGMYEAHWMNVLLFPLILLSTRIINFRSSVCRFNTLVWYLTSLSYMLLDRVFLGYPIHLKDDYTYYIEVWLKLTKFMTTEVATRLFQQMDFGGFVNQPFWVHGLVFFFILLYSLLLLLGQNRKTSIRFFIPAIIVMLLWFAVGHLHLTLGSINYFDANTIDRLYGTRILLFPSYSVIGLVVVVTAGICVSVFFCSYRMGASLALVIFTSIFYASSVIIKDTAAAYARVGELERCYYQKLTEVIPSLQAGTIVIIQGMNGPWMFDEPFILTALLRNVYGLRDIYFFTIESANNSGFDFVYDRENSLIKIHSNMRYPQPEMMRGTTVASVLYRPHFWENPAPTYRSQLRWVEIKMENVIWVQWLDDKKVFEINENKSNINRILHKLDPLQKSILYPLGEATTDYTHRECP